MARSYDFVERLNKDMSLKIMKFLEPTDLRILCCVSKSWYRFVVENELCKKICLNICPQASKILNVVQVTDKPERLTIKTDVLGNEIPEFLERDHKAYSILACFLWLYQPHVQIKDYTSESSMLRRPELQEICNSEDYDYFYRDYEEDQEPGYWRRGEVRPIFPPDPKTSHFQLVHSLCIVSEIHIKPFSETFHHGGPYYSPKTICFSMGFSKCSIEEESASSSRLLQCCDDDSVIWTYISSEYALAQDNVAQEFHFPTPVLLAGGILKIELLGGVPGGYPCVCHRRFSIRVVGQTLGPMFNIDILDDTGSFTLKCDWPKVYDRGMQMLKTAPLYPESFKVIPCRYVIPRHRCKCRKGLYHKATMRSLYEFASLL